MDHCFVYHCWYTIWRAHTIHIEPAYSNYDNEYIMYMYFSFVVNKSLPFDKQFSQYGHHERRMYPPTAL